MRCDSAQPSTPQNAVTVLNRAHPKTLWQCSTARPVGSFGKGWLWWRKDPGTDCRKLTSTFKI